MVGPCGLPSWTSAPCDRARRRNCTEMRATYYAAGEGGALGGASRACGPMMFALHRAPADLAPPPAAPLPMSFEALRPRNRKLAHAPPETRDRSRPMRVRSSCALRELFEFRLMQISTEFRLITAGAAEKGISCCLEFRWRTRGDFGRGLPRLACALQRVRAGRRSSMPRSGAGAHRLNSAPGLSERIATYRVSTWPRGVRPPARPLAAVVIFRGN